MLVHYFLLFKLERFYDIHNEKVLKLKIYKLALDLVLGV